MAYKSSVMLEADSQPRLTDHPKETSKKLKIAFIGSRGFPGFHAGVEKSLEEVCPRLSARGHEVVLYCSRDVATEDAVYKGTILRRTPALFTKHFETLSRTTLSGCDALLRDYDIIHFHSLGPALMSWLPRLSRSKTIVTVHGLDWQRAKWGALARASLRLGERSSLYCPDKTVVISRHLQRYFKKTYGRDVICIPNGVNTSEPVPANEISRKWGLARNSYLLFASRLVPEKEVHTLITAFRKIPTEKKLVIAGASWHSDGYVEDLKRLAAGDERILFTGWAGGELMKELFSNACLYCLPSQIEGLSLSLLEAMSFGICPVVSDIEENTDIVEDAGLSFRTGDPGHLAAVLSEALECPEKIQTKGMQARWLTREKYSWDRHVDGLENLYRELAGERSRQPMRNAG